MSKVLTILQARCSSSRLPGKVLRPLLGIPMLLRQIERVRRADKIGTLLVATSTDATDDALAKLCRDNGIACYRGSLADVLDRFYQAAAEHAPNYVVRLTGDCPLADPTVIDLVIQACIDNDADYASNALEASWPDGLDVEVFRFDALERAWKEGRLLSEREHVTPYIHKHPELFKLHKVSAAENLGHLRWTVDNIEDFEFVSQVYAALYPQNPAFDSRDVLMLLRARPELGAINTHIARNEGYTQSLSREAGGSTPGKQ